MLWAEIKESVRRAKNAALDYAWEWIVERPFRAMIIALGVGFLIGAFAVGSATGYARYASTQGYVTIGLPGVSPFAAWTEDQPQSTVHVYFGDEGICSTVAIAPGLMLTAAHCLDGLSPGHVATKDGIVHRVTNAVRSQVSDLALIYVEDAYCPCATVASKETMNRLKAGEKVVVVGFPHGVYDPAVNGEVVGLVVGSEELEKYLGPKSKDEAWPIYYPKSTYLQITAQLVGGHSGGGTFVERDGRWLLIGINSWAWPNMAQFFAGAPAGGYVVPMPPADVPR
jgi:S1-C subfamily serine protease